MGTQAGMAASEGRSGLVGGIVARVGTVVVFMVLQAVLLFGGAGRLDWVWAWVYLGICVATLVINGAVMLHAHSETVAEMVAERGRPGQTQTWDKAVSGLYALALYILIPLVAGLDVRFGWTRDLAVAWNLAGAVVLAAGFALAAWAMFVNAFFSTAIRIQSDRGQTVCRSGPYRLIRHPGYLGFSLESVGTALVLGSLWALLPAVVAVAFLVLRTGLEDRLLQAHLPGYREYVRDVRSRLVPGIW
jgi:protein-S-isoprenylcysteine O-methyltransferase Ste14